MKLGIDLGGTKIEILAMAPSGEEILRRRVPTPRGSYEPIVTAIRDLVLTVETELGKQGTLGIGIPGAIEASTGLVKNANTTELVGKPFQKDLEFQLNRPVRMANDANCFALSEAVDGAGAGADVVFGIILGTGCGGGIVVKKQLLVGCNAIAGEWGHNRLPDRLESEYPGPECYCGHKACVETFVSGTGLARDFAEHSHRNLKAKDITVLAEAGDKDALAAMQRLESRLARSLAVVINILDPDCIVVGGGLSNCQRLYAEVPKLWGPHVFSPEVRTRLVQAKFGDSSGVRGAAQLWN